MGSCLCTPVSSVTEGTNVAMYTEVGTTIITHTASRLVMEASIFDGMVYVIDNRLYYNSKFGNTFWCACTSGSDWFLSDIRNIEVITGTYTLFNKNGVNRPITINPGLKITFRDNTVLLTAMPDAVNFGLQLRRYGSTPSIRSRMGNSTVPPHASTASTHPFRSTAPPRHPVKTGSRRPFTTGSLHPSPLAVANQITEASPNAFTTASSTLPFMTTPPQRPFKTVSVHPNPQAVANQSTKAPETTEAPTDSETVALLA